MRFLYLIFLFSSLSLRSQDNASSVFTLKPSLGLNGCQVHGDNYSGYDKLGFFAGIAVNGRISSRASLELGFYFSQKGSRHNPNPKVSDYSRYILNLNYIDLPLSLRYMLNSRYYATLGPSIAYLVNYHEDINYSNMTGFYKFNKYEVGVNVGLGTRINDNWLIEFRCSNSVTAIRGYGVVSTVFYPNPVARFFNKGFYNNILTLMLTYKLEFKKSATSPQT